MFVFGALSSSGVFFRSQFVKYRVEDMRPSWPSWMHNAPNMRPALGTFHPPEAVLPRNSTWATSVWSHNRGGWEFCTCVKIEPLSFCLFFPCLMCFENSAWKLDIVPLKRSVSGVCKRLSWESEMNKWWLREARDSKTRNSPKCPQNKAELSLGERSRGNLSAPRSQRYSCECECEFWRTLKIR